MEISKFETFIKKARNEFNLCIYDYLEKGDKTEMKRFLKESIELCTCDFEYNVLKENLKEEFNLYLDSIRNEDYKESEV